MMFVFADPTFFLSKLNKESPQISQSFLSYSGQKDFLNHDARLTSSIH